MNGKRARNPIPDPLHPAHLDYLLAKSEQYSGDTLAQHTWDVICRLADQYQLRPDLAVEISDKRLWHGLYWACFFHDFGKAAMGFQERLKNPEMENQWKREKHRHEVLSLAFVEWMFPQGHPDRLPVICAMVCHHKDAVDIFDKYGGKGREYDQRRRIEFLVSQITPSVADDLWIWLERCGMEWQRATRLPTADSAVPARRESFGVEAICRVLDEFNDCIIGYEDGLFDAARVLVDMHYRGLILTADHAASAGTEPFPPLRLTRDI